MEHFNWITGAVLPYINFALFLFLAVKFFKKPLNEIAKKRKDNFENLYKQAYQAKEQAEKKSQELGHRLMALDAEISALAQEARDQAAKEAQQIIEKAEALAKHIRTEAQKVAEAELQSAKQQLKQMIVNEVKTAVAKKLGDELDAAQLRTINKSQIEKLTQLSF